MRRHAAAVAMAAAASAAGDDGGDGGYGDGVTVSGDVGVPSGGGDGRMASCVGGGGEGIDVGYWRRAAASRDGGDGAKM